MGWVRKKEAAARYGLSFLQIQYACSRRVVRCTQYMVDEEGLRAKLDEVRAAPKRWIYSTTAAKKYGVTRTQIALAHVKGLLRGFWMKTGRGWRGFLIAVEDLEANLERIKALPRYTEAERAARRLYARRWRMRKKLAFFCPRCRTEVKPPRGSKALESAVRGQLTPEEARRLVVIAHYRHAHTAYEDDMYSSKWLREGECRGDDGFDYECVATVASERAKRHYTKIAAELARMDGLLPAESPRRQGQPCRSS